MEEYDHNNKLGQPSTRTAMRRWRRTQVRGDFLPSPPRFGDRPWVPGGPSRFGGVLPQFSSLIGLYLRDPCPNAHQDRVCPVASDSTTSPRRTVRWKSGCGSTKADSTHSDCGRECHTPRLRTAAHTAESARRPATTAKHQPNTSHTPANHAPRENTAGRHGGPPNRHYARMRITTGQHHRKDDSRRTPVCLYHISCLETRVMLIDN